ncbi:Leukocyte receptor cluster member 1 [Bulinus truncatus]|nr:Leukocyte receptor cluster member 1 [Bulinus truncatus]
MNILPHKSWHVRTKKNIEKVRRDEEKAAAEEKEIQRRQALADQEARTELLRYRASNKSGKRARGDEDTKKDVDLWENDGKRRHINFFKDIEDGLKHGKNRENEAEKKQEQEEFEKKIGLLTYLDQSSKEAGSWYLQKREKKTKDTSYGINLKNVSKNDSPHSMDPLVQMSQYLKKKEKQKEKVPSNVSKVKFPKTSQSGPTIQTSSTMSVNQMREERLKREREEKARAAALFAKRKGGAEQQKEEQEDTRGKKRRYNAQYNPDFAKR